MTARLESRIFYLLLALACLPVWLTHYFPSNDGPEHLHNAFVLLHLNSPGFEIFRQYYTLNPIPNPNWIGHLILAGLMTFTSPLIAEKICLTLYLISFLLAARYALAAVNRKALYLIPLAVPLAYNWFFHMGFYNHCFSLAAFLVTMGYFLKHYTRLTWPRFTLLGCLLLALYFCHLSAVIMAIAVMSCLLFWDSIQSRQKGLAFLLPQFRLFFISLPSLVLIVLFFLKNQSHENISESLTLYERVRFYGTFLCSFSRAEAVFSLGFILLAGAVAFLSPDSVLFGQKRRQVRWLGLLLTIVLAAFFGLFIPANIGRGGFVYQRLVFFLLLLFFLYAARMSPSPKWRVRVAVVSLFLALGCCVYYATRYRTLSDYLSEYLSIADQLPPDSTVEPLEFRLHPKNPAGHEISFTTNPFRHAAGLLGTERTIVDLDNYEAEVGYFPLLWNPKLNPFVLLPKIDPETHIKFMDISGYPARTGFLGRIDYVYLWTAGPGEDPDWASFLFQQLRENYTLIYTTSPRGYGQLWKRNTPASQPATTP